MFSVIVMFACPSKLYSIHDVVLLIVKISGIEFVAYIMLFLGDKISIFKEEYQALTGPLITAMQAAISKIGTTMKLIFVFMPSPLNHIALGGFLKHTLRRNILLFKEFCLSKSHKKYHAFSLGKFFFHFQY